MNEFVRLYDDALPEVLLLRCEKLMDDIEPYRACGDGHFFDNIYVQNHDRALANDLANATWQIAYQYKDEVPLANWIPEPAITGFSLKRYPAGGYFKPHIDTQSPATTGRQLAFIFYFDSDAGTRFLWDEPKIVEAKRGRCCAFPPTWMFPHEGMTVEKSKMCLTTYLYNNAEVGEPWPSSSN